MGHTKNKNRFRPTKSNLADDSSNYALFTLEEAPDQPQMQSEVHLDII